MSARERVRKILVDHLGVDPDNITDESTIRDDLGGDSLDDVELVIAYEEEFEIEITDEEAETLQTVGATVTLIDQKVAAKA